MFTSRLIALALAAGLASASSFATDQAPAAASGAASGAKTAKADCVDMSKMHDHGAEKGVARSKSAGCKHDNPGLAKKDRHDHGKANKQQ